MLEKKIVELINDKDYSNFLNAIERLSKVPYAYRVKDFIMNYCESLMSQSKKLDVPTLKYDADGRAYVTTYGNLLNLKFHLVFLVDYR